MENQLTEEIIKEGVDTLYSNLGTIKAAKFLQLISISGGNSVKEIEEKTEQMSKDDVMRLIAKAREEKPELWRKMKMF